MLDVSKITSTNARMHPLALALAAAHPLYIGRWIRHSRAYDSTMAIVQFGHGERHFFTLRFLMKNGEATRLVGITANLPALLFGHNGRLIKCQDEMTTAFTILRFLIEPLVHPGDVRLVLPSREEDNDAFLQSIECPIQLQDPEAELLLAAHLSGCSNFTKAPRIFPGESVLFRSTGLDVSIYDKAAEAKVGTPVPEGIPSTRVELRFKTPRRL